MPRVEANANDPKKFLVVTYAIRPDEQVPEEEVLAHGQFAKVGQEGDNSKAILGYGRDTQCHGEKSTDGCTQLHAHAEHRVLSRLFDADGRVSVAWRKYHPKIAGGFAAPGEPFDQEREGTRIRVEVREIIDAKVDEITERTITLPALRRIEPDLQQRAQRARIRTQLRNVVTQFEHDQVVPVRQRLAQLQEQFRDLPNREEVDAAIAECEHLIDESATSLSGRLADALHQPALEANTVQALQAWLPRAQKGLSVALAPADALERKVRVLIQATQAIRGVADDLEKVWRHVTETVEHLPTLDASSLPLQAIQDRIEALMTWARTSDGYEHPERILDEQLPPIRAEIREHSRTLERLIAEQQIVRDAFQARVDLIENVRAGAPGVRAVHAFIDSGACYPGFAVGYWKEKSVALLEGLGPTLDDVSLLEYHLPADAERLRAAEEVLAPLAQLMDKLDVEMIRRSEGVHRMLQIGDDEFEAPTAWVKVLNVRPDGKIDVEVNIRNNADRPLLIEIHANPEEWEPVALSGRGRRAVFALENIQGPFEFHIVGIGDAGPAVRGQTVTIKEVNAPCIPITAESEGAIRHALPYTYTPAQHQPVGRRNVVLEEPEEGVIFTSQRIPGKGA